MHAIPTIPPTEVWEKLSFGALLIDVRSAPEATGSIFHDAVIIPHDQIAASIELLPVDKNQEIITFCAAGARSEYAKQVLQQLGYRNVFNGGAYDTLRHFVVEQNLL